MPKMDLKKELKHLYQPSAKEISVVDVPALKFLRIDGAGDPNGSAEYADAVAALFAVSYALKFKVKKGDPSTDYGVMPLEGLWWAEDMTNFNVQDRRDWLWTMMVMQPDFITVDLVLEAIAETRRKKPLGALSGLRFETFTEGKAAQILHIGPFSEEGPKVQRLHEFIAERDELSGKHHEIYLSDITKAAPKQWKTIIRQPMT
ncbi:hypothetical protein SAMN04488058_102263 [Deinococcus reticulitermitis]|uniref:GyrI-like small molecule binding domain-containing protein n=1 Tax=Deinococcus reticulitermitis TaxID=856736 RepID=A0A1H6USU8_9DEIO|nr:GyrI-like domain-containing protein [Deinococcus reticulitermitis]SEI93744.1 hypothetical protein SAMN04488058_102263 [Deinococcus reticulitermitis]